MADLVVHCKSLLIVSSILKLPLYLCGDYRELIVKNLLKQ